MPTRREPEPPADQHVVIAIVLLLLSGLTLEHFMHRLSLLLAPLGISPLAVVALIGLLRAEGGLTVPAPTPGLGASKAMQRGMISRRAMYMLAAARRLTEGASIAAERRLFRAHLAAERRRKGAAERVEAAAAKYGPVLGWWSQRDERTTPACFAAHGSNFSALHPPAMGWPGTIHAGNCRCKPVAPWPQGDFLDGTPAHVEDLLLKPLEY